MGKKPLIQCFGMSTVSQLQEPFLWERFSRLLPIPFHSVFIVMAVLLFEVNLPISLMLAWLSNPLTLVPILYTGFWFGSHIYHVHMINKNAFRCTASNF